MTKTDAWNLQRIHCIVQTRRTLTQLVIDTIRHVYLLGLVVFGTSSYATSPLLDGNDVVATHEQENDREEDTRWQQPHICVCSDRQACLSISTDNSLWIYTDYVSTLHRNKQTRYRPGSRYDSNHKPRLRVDVLATRTTRQSITSGRSNRARCCRLQLITLSAVTLSFCPFASLQTVKLETRLVT